MFYTRTIALVAMLAASSIARPAVAQSGGAERRLDPRLGIAAGAVQLHVLADSSYHRPRRVWVYTPPGYDARAAKPYPLMLAFDGAEYRDTMPLPMILDTLYAAKKAPAFVAVLVDDSAGAVRTGELGNAQRMADFLGYDVTYTEVPGGNHAPQWWETRLPDGIVLLSAGWVQR